jgi:hypothetical protein
MIETCGFVSRNESGREADRRLETAAFGHSATSPQTLSIRQVSTCAISATFLRTIVLEFPESAAHVATDPQRVYYLGAGCNPCLAPGAPFVFLTRPCLRPSPSLRSAHDMLDGLRQGLGSPSSEPDDVGS